MALEELDEHTELDTDELPDGQTDSEDSTDVEQAPEADPESTEADEGTEEGKAVADPESDENAEDEVSEEELDAPFLLNGERVTLRQLQAERVTNHDDVRPKWLEKTQAFATERKEFENTRTAWEAEKAPLVEASTRLQQYQEAIVTNPVAVIYSELEAAVKAGRVDPRVLKNVHEALTYSVEEGAYDPQAIQQHTQQAQHQQQVSTVQQQATQLRYEREMWELQQETGLTPKSPQAMALSRFIAVESSEGRPVASIKDAYTRAKADPMFGPLLQSKPVSGASTPTTKPSVRRILDRAGKKTGDRINPVPPGAVTTGESSWDIAKRMSGG